MDTTIKVPVECRSVYGEIPDENIIGFQITEAQLSQFAKLTNQKYIDAIIPLNKDQQIHPNCCPKNHDTMEDCVFWRIRK